MRAFLATILSVIAVGVLLIAYGLLVPRTAVATAAPMMGALPGVVQYDARGQAYEVARPVYASERVDLTDPYSPYAVRTSMGYPVSGVRPVAAPVTYDPYIAPAPAPRRVVTTSQAPRTRVVERPSGRDWKKTALVIGGSSAAGAGLGAVFGGKKGALIGAAIGGGASTLYEATKR
jgi:hypothetical protein